MKEVNKIINKLRKDYDKDHLNESNLESEPLKQFGKWLEYAISSGVEEPNAMNLATVSNSGKPSSRIVLLRNADEQGLVFFTNYNSHKGQDLDTGNHAAINFFWPTIQRQIRIEGVAERIDIKESDEYFDSRPLESKIGAWASEQSEVLSSRQVLEAKFADLEKQFKGNVVSRPEHWGGYRLIPDYFEFWQGRMNRLHDRIAYKLISGTWEITRLYP